MVTKVCGGGLKGSQESLGSQESRKIHDNPEIHLVVSQDEKSTSRRQERLSISYY
jgi:hypothetical protein